MVADPGDISITLSFPPTLITKSTTTANSGRRDRKQSPPSPSSNPAAKSASRAAPSMRSPTLPSSPLDSSSARRPASTAFAMSQDFATSQTASTPWPDPRGSRFSCACPSFCRFSHHTLNIRVWGSWNPRSFITTSACTTNSSTHLSIQGTTHSGTTPSTPSSLPAPGIEGGNARARAANLARRMRDTRCTKSSILMAETPPSSSTCKTRSQTCST